MSLNLKDKKMIVNKVREVTERALSAVVTDFSGIPVVKMNALRKSGREIGVYIRVIRNTLLHRVVMNTQFECLKSAFVGPTLIAYSMKYPSAAARLFKEFAKENIRFEFKAAAFEGKLISASQIDRLATLPTYKEAIVHLMTIMKEVSAGKLVRTFSAICSMKNTV